MHRLSQALSIHAFSDPAACILARLTKDMRSSSARLGERSDTYICHKSIHNDHLWICDQTQHATSLSYVSRDSVLTCSICWRVDPAKHITMLLQTTSQCHVKSAWQELTCISTNIASGQEPRTQVPYACTCSWRQPFNPFCSLQHTLEPTVYNQGSNEKPSCLSIASSRPRRAFRIYSLG